MKTRFFVFFVCAAVLSAGSNAMTNQQLISFCQQAATVVDKNKIPQNMVTPYNQCYAFIDGFLAGLMTSPAILVGAKKIQPGDWPLCLGNTNSYQIATDLLHFVRDGGEYRKEQVANTILARVVFDLYRCSN